MPEYRIEAREKFEVRMIYFVTAKTRAQAKALVCTGKVAYESHEVLEGRPGDEFIEFLEVTLCKPRNSTPFTLTRGQPMSSYRVETRERVWMRCVHIVNSDDAKGAIECVQDGDSDPVYQGPDDGAFDGDTDREFLSVTPVTEEPIPAQPEPPPVEPKNYTVLLLVPELVRTTVDAPQVFVAHSIGANVAAAIAEARHMAFTELDTSGDATEPNDYEFLAVFQGHHDELLPSEE